MQCCSWHRSVIALLALQVFLACMNGSCGSWLLLVSLRGLCWQVSAGSTAQYDLRNCWARLPLTQGSVSLQFPSLASRLVGKCHDSRLREKLPRPLSGHTRPAHTEPSRPPRPAPHTLMRACSALDPCKSISWRCLGLVAFVVVLGPPTSLPPEGSQGPAGRLQGDWPAHSQCFMAQSCRPGRDASAGTPTYWA